MKILGINIDILPISVTFSYQILHCILQVEDAVILSFTFLDPLWPHNICKGLALKRGTAGLLWNWEKGKNFLVVHKYIWKCSECISYSKPLQEQTSVVPLQYLLLVWPRTVVPAIFHSLGLALISPSGKVSFPQGKKKKKKVNMQRDISWLISLTCCDCCLH